MATFDEALKTELNTLLRFLNIKRSVRVNNYYSELLICMGVGFTTTNAISTYHH
jgi:hypothetical protein